MISVLIYVVIVVVSLANELKQWNGCNSVYDDMFICSIRRLIQIVIEKIHTKMYDSTVRIY